MMTLTHRHMLRWATLLWACTALHGCGEDEMPEEEPEPKNHWMFISNSEIGLPLGGGAQICRGRNGQRVLFPKPRGLTDWSLIS